MTDEEQRKIFSKNLRREIAKSGKQQKEICEHLNISTSTMNNWCQGNTLPRMNKVQLLADYFHINKTDLLEERPTSAFIETVQTKYGDIEITFKNPTSTKDCDRLVKYAEMLKALINMNE